MISVSQAGGSIIVNDTTFLLTLEYSLDDNIWQSSNSFPGLINGDYTVYIRDEHLCKTSVDFTVNVGVDGTITIPEPYFFYPDANPLRMKKNEQWDDVTIFKNDNNTLSCESTDRVVHTEKQRWRTADTINLQVKNNYDDLLIELSNNIGVPVPLFQKSTNLNNKEALDCKVVDLGNSTVGVYFISGNTYDYDTLATNGTYTLNGEVPVWGAKGNILTINAFNYEILEVGFNETLNVKQLVIAALIPDGDYISKSVYNIFGYELFELGIVLALETTPFNVRINYDGKLQYVSELVYSR